MSVEGYHEHAFFGLAKVIAANTTQDFSGDDCHLKGVLEYASRSCFYGT